MNGTAKFVLLWNEYLHTRVCKGSSVLFFLGFWITKSLSFLQQRNEHLNRFVHRIATFLPRPEFTIKNGSGIFVVQPFDDSMTICSDYFESHLRPWLERPSHRGIFLDIGANRGLYTVLALTKYGYQEVHAFEPNLDVSSLLRRNVAANDLDKNVTIHAIGLGRTNTTAGFSVDEMHKGGGRVTEEANSPLAVSIRPLDAILNETTAAHVSFIKIDTEGYEFEVIGGMDHILRNMPEGSCLMIESTEAMQLATILSSYQFIRENSFAHDHLFIKHAHNLHT